MEQKLKEMFDVKGVEMSVPPTLPHELRNRIGRQRVVMGGVVAAAAVAVVIGGFAGARSLSSDRAIAPANPDSQGTFADVHGWIAYRSGSELMAVDPTNPKETLSIGSSKGADPIGWSRDGTQLLLRPHTEPIPMFHDGSWVISTFDASQTDSPQDLYVVDSDGSRTRLTHGNGGGERSGTWGSFSPDGSEVVYACCGGGPGPWIIDADGGQPRVLRGVYRSPTGEPFSEWAAWSPDGSRIAFVDFWEDHPTYGDHAYTLSFVDPDSGDTLGDVVNVAAAGPTWSPDGSQLAFWAVVPDEDADPSNPTLGPGGDFPAQIFVVNADGSGLRQLTHTGDNRWPTWSPDGSRIAFARGELALKTAPDGSEASYVPPGTRQLFTMAADGTDVQNVEGGQPDGPIAWNPLAP
jgi:hypothetical protein